MSNYYRNYLQTCECFVKLAAEVTMHFQLLVDKMNDRLLTSFLVVSLLIGSSFSVLYDGPVYDYSAYTACKSAPEDPLYNGGIIKDPNHGTRHHKFSLPGSLDNFPAFVFYNLRGNTFYSFSSWIKVEGVNSSSIKTSVTTDKKTYQCAGTVIAKQDCWSFLKGGFVLNLPSNSTFLFLQDADGRDINISIASASLQPFSEEQWRVNQDYSINTKRERATIIHVTDVRGQRLEGAQVMVEQISRDFPFGSAIASTILGNLPYQNWFVERFNAAVFENELKWYATEPQQGIVNYTVPDQMLEFARANQIMVRGHNIFWENPRFSPSWVRNLTGSKLKLAVNSRIQSLMCQYKNEFIHWDVSNEMLHFDFYEQKLGPNASLQFFETAHQADPLATLFINEYNVVETCFDMNSTVDAYISRLRELERGGVLMDGIGLESHFTVPNPPLMRAILDKLATLNLPIWLTEVDISNTLDQETQARYLETVLREGFSHPSVNGIMLWTAIHPNGCYEMCLTDNNFHNLPAGDVVDNLLKEWQTGVVEGQTDEHGSFSFYGFLGEYKVNVCYGNRTVTSTFSLCQGDETRHLNIQL